MAFVPSFKTRVLVGYVNFACHARNVSLNSPTRLLDKSTICDTSKQFMFGGEDDAAFAADGLLDVLGGTGTPWAQYTAWRGASLPVTYAPSGLTPLAEAFLIDAWLANITPSTTHDGTGDFSVTAQGSGGSEVGTVLEDLTAVTIDGNGTSRDLTAASGNGGVAHLHVSEFSGLTSDEITVEHSTNGSTGWATLVTFATVTGVTSERVVVAPGTTVNRYLRVVDDVDGTGSITRSIAFARR